MRALFKLRVRLIAFAILLVAAVIVARLVHVQIIQGEQFRERAEAQYTAEREASSRGSIFFSALDGSQVSAASLASGYTLAIIPRDIENAEETFTALSAFVSIPREAFFENAGKTDDPYEEIAQRLSIEVGAQIREADIPGVRVHRERWRVYPAGQTAAHTIGFLGYGSEETLSGQYGLERSYDDVLVDDRDALTVNFFAEIFANITQSIFTSGREPGAHVVTSIEPSVQAFAEHILDAYGIAWSPDESGIIILEPKTGRVVGLAARPVFDPNLIPTADPSTFSNPLVEHVYEFGSIVKPLTIASALDAHVITPTTTYTDRGFAIYDTARIANFDGKARGVATMQDVLNQSLNTGVAYAVERMGTDVFREYFERFALREETGIDLPNEAAPLTANLDSPRTIEYVTASFGQGIAVTPIAMARSLATLANRGLVPSPHVAVSLEYPGRYSKKLGWAPERRAISEESAETVTRMLVEVVDTSLRDGTVKIPELSVAAKTGTAQIANPDGRGYYEDRYLHSFFGYFPAYEPRFLVFLYAVNPQGARYASETWTNPFMETVRFLMNYYRIEPDRPTLE